MNFQWTPSGRGRGCPHEQHWYGQIVQTNGVAQVRAICSACTAVSTPIAHREFTSATGKNPKVLPVFRDRRTDEPCARCRLAEGVELHHWAPQAKFPDAHDWPTSFLCVPCHRRWHDVMDDKA